MLWTFEQNQRAAVYKIIGTELYCFGEDLASFPDKDSHKVFNLRVADQISMRAIMDTKHPAMESAFYYEEGQYMTAAGVARADAVNAMPPWLRTEQDPKPMTSKQVADAYADVWATDSHGDPVCGRCSGPHMTRRCRVISLCLCLTCDKARRDHMILARAREAQEAETGGQPRPPRRAIYEPWKCPVCQTRVCREHSPEFLEDTHEELQRRLQEMDEYSLPAQGILGLDLTKNYTEINYDFLKPDLTLLRRPQYTDTEKDSARPSVGTWS